MLDIGARDGHFSRLLTEYFDEVTALDLERPTFNFPRVLPVAGDVNRLQFADGFFDVVFCAEVLEHIPSPERACREIMRVARHEIVIGVPYQQDIRIGRMTCRSCGKVSPPWGHVNTFDDHRLASLFPGLRVLSKSFVGVSSARTNPVSTALMDLAGNPWGPYDQDEPCTHCGAKLAAPQSRAMWQRGCSALALRINHIQSRFARPHGNWIHLVMSKA